ncbi:DNA topoisomerase 2-binding protein 1-A isoform X2 [Aplysia californica]|uniref:DNA topoisomerase 2-binding protein 1-A isoform X2 n=1 Tax=Aplysia californica TaxID=6500 RepID=A0ABM1VXY2_APLCA|nr:DNA topoisomerase 2-binding protein 1-A isoform X2 [Aplysia californica]
MAEEFEVIFVKPSDDEENSSTLSEAFEGLKESTHNFKPYWTTQEECLKVDGKGKQIYICDPFSGPAFECLKRHGYRIYGPRCILSCLAHGVELPRSKMGPVYNLAMKGVKICCTSIDKAAREEITKKVHLMAGDIDCNLTKDVTHVVAGEVGSHKYMVALDNEKQVMVKDWVFKVWEMAQDRHIVATDDCFDKYKCPAFLGLTVVVSGFSSSERNQLKSFVTRGGGKYSGELKMNECTHLVVKEAKGAKYEAAKNWKIRILHDKWVYDCMDKKRYLDPEPYQCGKNVPGRNVKTSTPERRSVIGPHISDVSAITSGGNSSTFHQADETSDMTVMRLQNQSARTVAETRIDDTTADGDITVTAADVFLDDCKIYFSGLRPALEEKLRKIVISGGGLRTTELSESVTHVVMGELVSADILQLNKMSECPFVVRTDWLLDCFRQRAHLTERVYLREDLGLPMQGVGVLKTSSSKSERLPSPQISKKQNDSANKETSKSDDMNKEAPSDLEMAELLSQYMEPPDEGRCENNEKEQPNREEKDDVGANREMEEELTQDPTEVEEQDERFFTGKTFIILGFGEEETDQLTEFIVSKGGRVFSQDKKRRVIDIAIVPLMGFPVDVTVSEILTNGWLQMCIEADRFLEYDEHWVSRPIELPDNEPLSGCCISVSGYVGVERECIIHLAQSLGALWLLACVSARQHIPEAEYAIEVLERKRSEVDQSVETPQRSGNKSALSNTPELARSRKSYALEKEKSISPDPYEPKEGVERKSRTEDLRKDPVAASTSPGALSKNHGIPSEIPVPSSSSESVGIKDKNASVDNPMAQVTHQLLGTSDGSNSHLHKSNNLTPRSACRPNQSENITAGNSKTPVSLRRQLLAGQGSAQPMSSTPLGLVKGGGETPSTFLKPGFKPNFNLDGVFTTPDTKTDLDKSTPLGEVFSRQITKAAQNSAFNNASSQDGEMPASQGVLDQQAPLHGVVIAVAKKLGHSHDEYNMMVVELGGDYSWHSGDHVTHFVFQGRPNDVNKEFRKAREEGKTIVSPHWLYACKEQNCRVDETLFPHNYNPNYRLMMTPSKRGTPSRSTRAAAKMAGSSEVTTKPDTLPGVTPAKKAPLLNIVAVEKKNSSAHGRSSRKDNPVVAETSSGSDASSAVGEVSKNMFPTEKGTVKGVVGHKEDTPHNPSTTHGDDSSIVTKESSVDRSKSQEIKKALTETLGNALAGASRSNRTRRKGKRLNLSGQLSASESNLSGNSPWGNKESKADTSAMELPQSVQVTWDDPTGRLEEEKLAHRLARVCDPSQNTDDMLAAMDYQVDKPASENGGLAAQTSSKLPSCRSPTPEPPPLAFPVAKPASKVLSPEPVELLSEESSDSRAEHITKAAPVILVSGMSNEERVDYSALVEQLGGKMLEKQHFDPTCTHLIVGQPTRNEKFLSCVASGKWVLHKSFLEACRKEGKFVAEEAHEWGSSFTLPLMQDMTAQANKLAAAAHKWRKKVAAMKKSKSLVTGAFHGWKILLCLDRAKQENFQRLLAAGGADVSILRPPFPSRVHGTHVFIELNKVKISQEDLEKLVSEDIHCLKPEFIPAYLTDDPPPDPSEFCPGEIVALKACMPDPPRRKRQLSSNDSKHSSNKAPRR